MKRNGFTLIELLVVIAIIGLLATLSAVSFSTSREKARLAGGASFSRSLFNARGADAIGVWNFDEASGSTIYSRAGMNGLTGTITGAAWITDGPNGKSALQFSGSNQFVSLGSITLPSRVTVSAWIRTSSASGQYPFFSNRGSGLYFGINGGRLFTYYNTAIPPSMNSVGSITVTDGKWHHVAWSSDGVTATMFIDGKFNASITQTRPAETGNGYIGYDVPNGQYFTGSVAELGIYTEMVTAKDIERMYAEGAKKYLANNI